ncbi:MAG: thrombospondin type 3 repeat-containing protein, partial [Bacteroidota bacterium]|nr:thrombospondin type 3 repeat-containing protein [Bacteroidota bacterium]
MRKQLLIALFFSVLVCNAQKTIEEIEKEILTIGAGPQINSFFGDIGSRSIGKIFTNARPCLSLDIEKRISDLIGLQVMFVKGKLSENIRSNIVTDNLNFESSFTKLSTNLILNSDHYLNIKSNISPYLSVGAGLFIFGSYTDLLDANNISYNYWSDGTIRDLAESDTNAANASMLYRDYEYETSLENDSINYNSISLVAPVTVGIKWKINPYLQGRVYGTYNHLFTDWIDNISSRNDDYYLSFGFTMNYVIHKLHFEKKEKIDVDIESFNRSDEDNDGIIDIIDECPHTPKSIKVDLIGCPIDTDKDGVPDHIDKEPNSTNYKYVDEMGRGITDSLLFNRSKNELEIEVQRNQTFSDSTIQDNSEEIREIIPNLD